MARSGNVDERIVEMQFENRQFEKNANESISTLDKLKKALNLESAAKGFEEVEKASKGIDLSRLQDGVAAIGEKFSMMGILGITAMQRISNAAIDMGINLGKTLIGLDGISEGFSRYAEKSNHVKTIMTATGESIETVSNVLDDLNWFTDETSYRFTDMVNTMGKFTSAGVKLNVAKEAVEGIALWAAESGQNAQTASRAMFQLAQAYGRGTIQLQDWMSVEQANMSTAKIQNELIAEGGEIAEAAIAKYGGFRDSLRSGWLTTEIFNKVMQKYSEGVTEANYENGKFTGGVTKMSEAAFKAAQEARTYKDAIDAVKEAVSTGWSHTFELVFGNAEEAAIVWTDLANTLISVADKFTAFRNNILEVWNDIGGRDKLVKGAYDMLSGIGRIGNYLSKSFGGTMGFGKSLEELKNQEWATSYEARQLFDELDSLYEQMDRMKANGDSAERLEEWQQKIDDVMSSLNAMNRAHILDDITESFQKFAERFKEAIHFEDTISRNVKRINELNKLIADLGDSLDTSGRRATIQKNIESLVEQNRGLRQIGTIVTHLSSVWEGFLSVLSVGKEIFTGIKNALSPILNVLSTLISPVLNVAGAIGSLVKAFNNALVSSGVISKSFKSLGDTIADFLVPIVDTLGMWLDDLAESIRNWASDIENGVSPIPKIFESVKNAITGFFNSINIDFPSFTEGEGFFSKVSKVLGSFLKFLEPIKDKIGNGLKYIFEEIKKSFANLSFQDVMAAISTGSLVTFLGKLSDLVSKIKGMFSKKKEDGGGVKGFFDNVKEGITSVTDAVKDAANVTTLLEVAGAIVLISLALARLSAIPEQDLSKAFVVITEVFGELFGFLYLFQKSFKNADMDKLGDMSTSLLKVAGAMYIMGIAVSKLSDIPGEGLRNAVLALGAVLLEFVGFAKLTQKVEGFKSDGIIKMAVGLVLIASAVKKLGNLEPDQLVKGILAMGAVLLEIAGFQFLLKKIDSDNGLAGVAAGMILIASSMMIFSAAVKSLGNIPVDNLNQGLGAMAAVLAMIAAVMFVLKDANILGTAAAFVIMSIAIGNLALSIALLSQFKWQQLATGLGAIVGAIAGIGLVLGLMAGLTKGGNGLLKAAGAILIVAAAMNLLVIPLMALGQLSMDQIVSALAGLAGALVIMGVAAGVLGALHLDVILLKIGAAMALFGVGLVAVGVGLGLVATSLVAAVTSIMASLSIIVAGLGTFIAALVMAIAEAAGSIALGIGVLGAAILNGLAMLVDPVVQLVLKLVTSIAEGLAEYAPRIGSALIEFILGLMNVVRTYLPEIIQSGIDLALGFINGIATGLVDNTDAVFDAIENLARSIVYFALEYLQRLTENIPMIGDDISKALEGAQEKVKEGMATSDSEEAGKEIPKGVARGIESGQGEVEGAANNLGDIAISTISSKVDEGAPGIVDKFNSYFAAGGTESSGGVSFADSFINNTSATFDARSGEISAIGSQINTGLLGGEEGNEALVTGANSKFDTILGTLTARLPEMNTFGSNSISELVAGQDSKKKDVETEAKTIADTSEKPVKELPGKFNDNGVNAMTGLINGLESLRGSAVAKVKQIADEMQAAFTFSMQIESPSKVFFRYGQHIDRGLINGLDSLADGAVNSVKSIAHAMSDAMAYEAESSSLTPTITPVVDLTNINGKASSLDSMFSATRSAAIAASMDINSQVTQFDQLVDVTNRILGSIQNGSDLYLDDNILAGRINRRLGAL